MKALLAVSIVMLPAVVAPADGAAQNTRLGQGFSRAAVDGVELEYQTRGTGEAVVLVHAGIFAEWFAPLLVAEGAGGVLRRSPDQDAVTRDV